MTPFNNWVLVPSNVINIVINQNAKVLFKFFQLCFTSGLNPTEWDSNDIKPIPKQDKDQRNPLQNCSITLMSYIANLYSSIVNRRLQY